MNLRDKFLWNLGIILSAVALIWSSWNLFNKNNESADSLKKFENEQVGTDNELQKKVSQLEKIYVDRDAVKFIIADNPVDLNRVISIDGGSNSKRRKNLWCSGIYTSNKTRTIIAQMVLKDKTYNVIKGDSIGGGQIVDITNTEVVFKKNEKVHTYKMGIDNNLE